MRSLVSIVLVANISLCLTAQAGAAVYSYTGQTYSETTGTYTTDDFLTVEIETDVTLESDLDLLDISTRIVSYSAFGGNQILTPENSQITWAFFSTNSQGDIVSWRLLFTQPYEFGTREEMLTQSGATFPPLTDQLRTNQCIVGQAGCFAGVRARNFSSPGMWERTVVPEPSTALLIGVGLVAVGCSRTGHRIRE